MNKVWLHENLKDYALNNQTCYGQFIGKHCESFKLYLSHGAQEKETLKQTYD